MTDDATHSLHLQVDSVLQPGVAWSADDAVDVVCLQTLPASSSTNSSTPPVVTAHVIICVLAVS